MTDLDIIVIDAQIHANFQAEFDRLPEYRAKLDNIIHTLSRSGLPTRIKTILSQENYFQRED